MFAAASQFFILLKYFILNVKHIRFASIFSNYNAKKINWHWVEQQMLKDSVWNSCCMRGAHEEMIEESNIYGEISVRKEKLFEIFSFLWIFLI